MYSLSLFIRSFMICALAVFCLSFNVPAFAQADDANASTEPAAEMQVDAPAQTDPEITTADTTLEDAYKALTEAEREFLEAAKASVAAGENEVGTDNPASGETLEINPDTEGSGMIGDPQKIKDLFLGWLDKVVEWLTSVPFLAQVGAIILAFFLAPILAGQLRKRAFFFRDKPADGVKLKVIRDYVYRSANFLRAVMLVALLALFAIILKSIDAFGDEWLVKLAQGVAVVFLLYKAIKEFITHDLFQRAAIWIVIPTALLAVFGFFNSFIEFLDSTTIMSMGDTPITLMTLIRLGIFGGIFFWLGNLSNDRGQTAIRSQESLDVATREVVAKLFQIILFVVLFVLILSFAGIPLSGLVVIFSAIGLGIGFGLQPLAANFVSGLIILFDRSVRKGDFVVLPEGQEGYVEAINMRSTTVETTDGKDIMVPNTTFIEGTYENWTHKDPRQRYEVHFQVAYNTDIDKLEDILIPIISGYDKVLMEPEEPDLELREFGDFGIKFAIEFWVSGIDDGPNKFTSDLNFMVWRALKENGIQMPLPQREVRMLKD